MGWDVALKAIGGGLQGGLDMYSWQKDRQEDRRRFDANADMNQQELDLRQEEYGLRRERLVAELAQMAQAVADGQANAKALGEFIDTLPEHLRGPARRSSTA